MFRLMRRSTPLAIMTCAAALSLHAAPFSTGTVSITGTEPLTGSNRVTRNNISSTFAVPKTFPGTSICGGTCSFKTVTVTPPDVNVVVKITGITDAVNVFAVAYKNSFNPAALATNYLGDPGFSPTTGNSTTFEVAVAPGDQLVLAFMNSISGFTGTVGYELSLAPVQPTQPPAAGVPAVGPLALSVLAVLLAACAGFTLRRARA